MNAPAVATAHFAADTRYMQFGSFPTGRLLKLEVPKSMERRRVYAAIVQNNEVTFATEPQFTGELVFRLLGQVVLILPFQRGQSLRVSIRPGAEGHSNAGGIASYSGFQPGVPDSLAVTIPPGAPNAEHVIPPFNLVLSFDTVEMHCQGITSSEPNLAAVLACHSEGFSE